MPKEFELENIVLRSSGPLPPKASLGQHVFQDLRKMIIRGEIPAGGRLVESAVAAAFGISRTPVREALHKLEREGLATPTIQGGYTVASLTRKEIEDERTLSGRKLELAWLKDPLDVSFLQIQGSGRLKLPDGSIIRVGYRSEERRVGKECRSRWSPYH